LAAVVISGEGDPEPALREREPEEGLDLVLRQPADREGAGDRGH
jgi:hypothetical protein